MTDKDRLTLETYCQVVAIAFTILGGLAAICLLT